MFPPWRGAFYPPGLTQARELSHASRQVTAIEINGTFYGSQKPASFRRWHDETPDDFVFSLKGSRFVTHRRDLATAGPSIERFFASGVLELGAKLGPDPVAVRPVPAVRRGRFRGLSRAAAARIDGRALRHVVEVRHSSFAAPAFAELLRRHEVAVALVDDEKYPAFDEITADFVYARLRRCSLDEPAGYSPQALDRWAERVPRIGHSRGRDCFVYFINGAKVRAPAAALALLTRLRA